MKFATHLDRRILQTIRGRTSHNPQTLMGIVAGVDASERLVLTYKELSDGLERLVASGQIAESEPRQFYEASPVEGPAAFSGITEADHASAVQEYRDWFQSQLDELGEDDSDEGFVWQKLALRWATPNNRYPTDEDEEGAQQLAMLIDPIISESGLGEINGFEHGSGGIDILIFGQRTDSDVDQIYELLAPSFRGFPCPPGSRIVRYYNERNTEIESDVVPDTIA